MRRRAMNKWEIMDIGSRAYAPIYRERIDYGEDQPKIGPEIQKEIFEMLSKKIKDYSIISLPDYNKRTFTKDFAQKIINLARAHNIPVLVDPKPKNISFFRGCNLVCPNLKEAMEISNLSLESGNGSLREISKRVQEKVGSDYTIVTCGKRGAHVYSGDNGGYSGLVKTIQEKEIDVTGLGDVFASTLSLGLGHINGSSNCEIGIFDLVRLANTVAGSMVGKKGTGDVSIDRVKTFLRRGKVKV